MGKPQAPVDMSASTRAAATCFLSLIFPPSHSPLVQRARNRKSYFQFIVHALKWNTVRGLIVIAQPPPEADEDYRWTHPSHA